MSDTENVTPKLFATFFIFSTYSPGTGRFLAEDPAGFVGGPNSYAYVRDDPTDFSDPFGKLPFGALIGAANGARFGGWGAISGNDWTWRDVVGGAVIGAVTGFGLGLPDPTEGVASSAPISAAADWAGQALHKLHNQQNMSAGCYNWGEVAGAGIGGGLGAGLGAYVEGLGAAAGLSGNALTFAESVLGNNVGLITTPLGGVAGNGMSGRNCGCQ